MKLVAGFHRLLQALAPAMAAPIFDSLITEEMGRGRMERRIYVQWRGGTGWLYSGYRCGRVTREVASSIPGSDNAGISIQRRIIEVQRLAHYITFSVYRPRRLLEHDQANRFWGRFNQVLEQ